MLKVMHLIHGLNTGGAETLVKDYAIKLDKSRFEVVILCFEHFYDSPYEDVLKKAGIHVIYICDEMPHYPPRSIIDKISNRIYRYLLIKKYILLEKPDVLHTHLPVNSYIKFAKPSCRLRIIHTVHNEPRVLWFPVQGHTYLGKCIRKKDFNSAKWLVKHYNMRFIVLHESMRLEVNKLFNVDNSIVLNNGIDFKRFENSRPAKDVRKELGIALDAFVLGHVGRFSNQKNHSFLVDVFKAVYEKRSNAFLLMIGEGTGVKEIENKLELYGLKEHYKILSNRSDIPDLLNAMDVFIFPSQYEGLGIAAIEAQKMGTACFVSDSVPEAVMVSDLVKMLPLSAGSKKWAEEICDGSFSKANQLTMTEWDINNVVKRLEDIYTGMI